MGLGRFLRHAAQDAEGLVDPRNYYLAGKMAVTHPVGFGEALGKSYLNLARHPIRSFESNPFSSTLAVLPIGAGLGAAAKGGRVASLMQEMRAAGYSAEDAAAAASREAVKVRLAPKPLQPDLPSMMVGHHPGGIRPPGRATDSPSGFSMHRMLGEMTHDGETTAIPGIAGGTGEFSPLDRLKRGERISGGAQGEHPITGRDYPDEVYPGAREQGMHGPAQYMSNSPQWLWLDRYMTRPGENGMYEGDDARVLHDTHQLKKMGGDNGMTGGLLSTKTTQEARLPYSVPNPKTGDRILTERDMVDSLRKPRTATQLSQYRTNPAYRNMTRHDSKAGAYPDIGFRLPPGKHVGKGGNPLAQPEMQSFLRNAQSNADLEETLGHFDKSRKVPPKEGGADPADIDQAKADVAFHANQLLRGDDGAGAEFSKRVHPLGSNFKDYGPNDQPESLHSPGGRQFGSTINGPGLGHPHDSGGMKGSAAYINENMHNPDWGSGGLGHRPPKVDMQAKAREVMNQLRTEKGGKMGFKLTDMEQRGLVLEILKKMYPGYGSTPIITN